MFQPNFTRIQKEDLGKDSPKALDPVVYQVNLLIDYLKTAFAKSITIQDNLINPTNTQQITSTGVPAKDTLKFAVTLPSSYQPRGLIIINCQDLSGAIVGNAIWAELQPGLQNGDVVVRAIYGLTANHTYQLTFLVFQGTIMATLNQNNTDENDKQPTISGTSSPTGSGTGSGVGTQQTSQIQQNQAPQNNNGYTDVASYLNANQGGGSQLGSQVASNLNNTYNTTKSGIDTSAQSANQAINAGYTPENMQLIQQVASNPTSSAANADTLGQFQGQLNDTYGGPTSWDDFGTQQGKVAQAQQEAGLVNTPGGNNVLIQQVENQTNPGQNSQGINQLDTLLYQGNPNAVQQAQTAAQPFSSLNDYINSQNTAIGNNITGATNAANQTSQDALNAFTGSNSTLTNLNNNINSTTAQDLSQAQAQQAQIKNDLSNLYSNGDMYAGQQNYKVGQLSPQDLSALGMTQDQANQFYSALQNAGTSQYEVGHNFGAASQTAKSDLGSYLQQQDPTKAITNATTATPEQYAQMAAIQQLLGAKTPQGAAISPLNTSQAGTYNPTQLNQFNYGAATSDANTYAQAQQKAAQDQANALTAQADAAHNASKGGFLKNLETVASAINPVTYVDTALQAKSAQTGLDKLKGITHMSSGGEVTNIDEYLNKRK